MRMQSVRLWIAAGIIVQLFVFQTTKKDPQEHSFEIAKNLDIFATLFKEINTYYVDDIKPTELMQKAIEALLSELDPYTNYISEDRIEDYRTMTTGRYAGIGINIRKQDGNVVVTLPFEKSPARQAGLQIGDRILRINGVGLADKSTDEITALLKGQANSLVSLEVYRPTSGQTFTLNIVRKEIKLGNVPYYGMVDEHIGYIQLVDFTMGAADEVRQAMEALKKEGATAFILDLRNNPGGLLSEAVSIVNLFIPKNELVVYTRGRLTEWNKEYRTLVNPFDLHSPVVVLVNQRSASASEIVAGALQDYDRAVLVGQRTFGKGLLQVTRPLSYNAQLKITIAKYFIPSGRCIQAIDYSTHLQDGSFYRIPDSLRRAFRTRLGRLVYDGAGLEPDLVLPPESNAEICNYLLHNHYFFDYAVSYAALHPLSPGWQPDHQLLEDFLGWLESKGFDYQNSSEQYLAAWEEQLLQDDQSLYDSIADDLRRLRQKIRQDYRKLIRQHKECILEHIEAELLKHIYFEKAEAIARFDDDAALLKAKELLQKPELYKAVLAKDNNH